ncbi:PREDICTED: ghrelin O-acyltransferase isoform X2 [Capra hircus]|uniref:ghrelin O-acyltransferase isoform X2 n=1 Tax=Capra hircus TaxID=9925 RepID=UPI0008468C4B|nr:PREDICTED: ghrelin O-acyltransferase isoform X2 [Capra hircus]
MDWLQLFFLDPVSLYQGAAFPFALLFNYLCFMDSFSTQARFCITLSSLMLLTQKVTSLSLDIREGKVVAPSGRIPNKNSLSEHLRAALPYLSYLLFFPALLGGPLCSFQRFQVRVEGPSSVWSRHSFWALTWRALQILGLESLKVIVRGVVGTGAGLGSCEQLECIFVLWSTAGLFKLTYYSHWLLDDSLLRAAGFGSELGRSLGEEGLLPDADIWTLETTHRIALFARKWNQSTARWLRRLVFQQRRTWPLLQTFVFSAWWHGLHPGQVFGFLCWAVMVEADYVIHAFASVFISSWPVRLLYRALAWAHTQLIIAYIILAVEARSLSSLRLLWNSYSSVFPTVYCTLLLLLAKRKHKCN